MCRVCDEEILRGGLGKGRVPAIVLPDAGKILWSQSPRSKMEGGYRITCVVWAQGAFMENLG
jgi:hypothetical protein